MARRVGIDKWLFAATLLLTGVGVVMVFSASEVLAGERFGSPYHFVVRQLGWALAGLAAMAVLMRVDYRRWKHPGVVFTFLGLTTLLLVAVLFLDRTHNTHRWIRMGAFSFQPSELAKPALILFLAFFLEGRLKSMDDWRHTLLPVAVPVALFAALIIRQPDLGTASRRLLAGDANAGRAGARRNAQHRRRGDCGNGGAGFSLRVVFPARPRESGDPAPKRTGFPLTGE